MPGLDEALHKLAGYRRQFERFFAAPEPRLDAKPGTRRAPTTLSETDGFGSNPGNLRMLSFMPDRLPPRAPLVVVLHGCTQSAADYDHGAGWSTLAARFGFAVLFPEQRQANNPNLCFNWFMPQDTRRGEGEVASIRQMIDRMVADHGLDPARIGITGLSAGGAMSAAMLACYPESFSHGAIIAGLPYGTAGNVQEAFAAMFQGVRKPGATWAELVTQASPHRGPWPKISIWHGSADATVKPANAEESIKQWTTVHRLPAAPSSVEAGAVFTHSIWRGPDGTAFVESYDIAGMAHGTPIAPRAGSPNERCGHAGPYMLDVGISSTYLIARSWGLARDPIAAEAPAAAKPAPVADPGAIIAKALRAAGLMR